MMTLNRSNLSDKALAKWKASVLWSNENDGHPVVTIYEKTSPLRYRKEYTVSQWNSFKQFHKKKMGDSTLYADTQEVLCRKYDIVLTDWKSRSEKTMIILKKINFENLNKGIDIFNKGVQQFGGAANTMTKELSSDTKRSKKSARTAEAKGRANLDALMGRKEKEWKPKKTAKRKKKKVVKSKDESNLDKIWGGKKRR